jgi:hypothetical protein
MMQLAMGGRLNHVKWFGSDHALFWSLLDRPQRSYFVAMFPLKYHDSAYGFLHNVHKDKRQKVPYSTQSRSDNLCSQRARLIENWAIEAGDDPELLSSSS